MSPTPAIPTGSLILVTGATGFAGSYIVLELLKRGYKVRGTVRDLASASWLHTSPAFAPYASALDLVCVPDLGAPHAFDAAVADVVGIVHTAGILSLSPDPATVIQPTVRGMRGLLEAAAAMPSVRAFVYTSSITTGINLDAGVPHEFGPDTWNDQSVAAARQPPLDEAGREMIVYAASKTEAERALWEFKKVEKPHFEVAAVLPAQIIGAPLHPKHNSGASHHLAVLYYGRVEGLLFDAGPFVDAQDMAILHVAALLDPSAYGKRIFAFGQETTRDAILAVLRSKQPDHKFTDDFDDKYVTVHADVSEPLRLLKEWNGQDGWRSIEDTVADYVDSPYVQ